MHPDTHRKVKGNGPVCTGTCWVGHEWEWMCWLCWSVELLLAGWTVLILEGHLLGDVNTKVSLDHSACVRTVLGIRGALGR